MSEWKTTEVAILRKHYARDGAQVCAELTGRTVSTVYVRASKLGLKRERAGETLESIKTMCDIDGDCWIWRGGLKDGAPLMWLHNRQVLVRRVAYALARGDDLDGSVVVRNVCDEARCVNPAHQVKHSRMRLLRENGRKPHSQATKLAMTLRARARSVLTPEAVAEIRESEAGRDELAERFGVTRETIRRVQVGESWAPLSGLFALGGKAMNEDSENTRFGLYRRCCGCGVWQPVAGFFPGPSARRCTACGPDVPRAVRASAPRQLSETSDLQRLLSGAEAMWRAA